MCFKVSVNFESCTARGLEPGCAAPCSFLASAMELLRFEMEKCVKSMFSGLYRKEHCSCEEACSQMTDRALEAAMAPKPFHFRAPFH